MIRHIRYHGPDGWPLYAVLLESSPSAPEAQGLAPLLLLHGGGPDHESLLPLARLLADHRTVILPDVRGYGLSVCNDPSRHTWQQYSEDVAALLDHLGYAKAVLGGAGLGATISLRTALARAERVTALVLISVEDIEDDAAKQAEIEFMDAFAERVRHQGIDAAWEPILPELAPVIGAMVRDAFRVRTPAASRRRPRSAATGRSRTSKSLPQSRCRRWYSPVSTIAIRSSSPIVSPRPFRSAGEARHPSPPGRQPPSSSGRPLFLPLGGSSRTWASDYPLAEPDRCAIQSSRSS